MFGVPQVAREYGVEGVLDDGHGELLKPAWTRSVCSRASCSPCRAVALPYGAVLDNHGDGHWCMSPLGYGAEQ